MDEITQKIIEDGNLIIHPIRYGIIEYLSKYPDGKHIQKIADDLRKERRVISYHLLELERNGLVNGNYEISQYSNSKGRAIKKYVVTDRTKHVLYNVSQLIAGQQKTL